MEPRVNHRALRLPNRPQAAIPPRDVVEVGGWPRYRVAQIRSPDVMALLAEVEVVTCRQRTADWSDEQGHEKHGSTATTASAHEPHATSWHCLPCHVGTTRTRLHVLEHVTRRSGDGPAKAGRDITTKVRADQDWRLHDAKPLSAHGSDIFARALCRCLWRCRTDNRRR